MKRYWQAIRYYRKFKSYNFYAIIVIGAFVLALVFRLYWQYSKSPEDSYNLLVDPFINSFTFLLAIFLGLESIYNEYEETLPLLLTVHFVKPGMDGIDDHYVMTCHKAVLTSEADMRQWAQQIGQQMNGGKLLSFKPFFKITKRKELIRHNESNVLHYEIVYFLSALPGEPTDKKKDGGQTLIAEGNARLKEEYLIWWDNDPKTSDNRFVYVKGHPTEAISEADAEKIWATQN